jgi:hypothetical protein
MRYTKLLSTILIVFLFSCNQNINTQDHDIEEGIRLFSTYGVDIEVVPNIIPKDSLITLTMTCYPAMTGVGVTWLSLGTYTALEYPRIDTIRTSTNVIVHVSFISNIPFKQQWKFRLLGGVPPVTWNAEVRATFDSVYIADSSKMYWVHSEELVKILGGAIGNNDAGGSVTVPTNP